ncbi:MAG: PglZ domain-containing protein [Thermoflexales bacterium]|nr:PglZ domain-containing protein [Thermoflexales bacterium]
MKQLTDVLHLDAVLDRTPIVYEGEPLLLAGLNNLSVERDAWQYVQRADGLAPLPVERTVLLGPATGYFDRWPVVQATAKAPADLAQFNRSLFQNYDRVCSFAFTQSGIASRIEEDLDVDVIVLLLIDGLSYTDWMDYPGVQSCLVEGPTITPVGFQNIIGRPSIARRLFEKGFSRRLGFSYWERDNALTDVIFHGFDPAAQMLRVSEFKEVLQALDKLPTEQTYIQILVNGMDSICHSHRDRPPVEATARYLYQDVLLALVERLQKAGATALVYATADHGILWKPELGTGHDLVVVRDERINSHRYARGSFLVPDSKQLHCHGANYTVLAYPYLFKSLTSLEWGTHGGISFQESVVPFVKLEVV